jgi:hypothetical protein
LNQRQSLMRNPTLVRNLNLTSMNHVPLFEETNRHSRLLEHQLSSNSHRSDSSTDAMSLLQLLSNAPGGFIGADSSASRRKSGVGHSPN